MGKPKSMKRYIFTLTALTTALFLSSSLSLPAKETGSSDSSLFPGKILDSKGKSVSSKVLDNKIVGIYFSAQWCPPCRHFTPSLVEFRNKNAKEFEGFPPLSLLMPKEIP